jgi:hypothetical protein
MFVRIQLMFLLIATTVNVVGSSKVIERFGGSYRGIRCSIWLPQGLNLPSEFNRLNCSIKSSEYIDSGNPSANGTYNGVIGYIQRQEVDLVFLLVRPDGLPFEPGLIGPMIHEADAIIITATKNSEKVSREILQFLNDFDFNIYIYLIIVTVIMCIFYTFVGDLNNGTFLRDTTINVLKNFFENLEDAFNCLIDQENFQPKTDASRVLTFFFACFMFVSVYGIFLNKVGADLIAKTPASNIDNIDYFLNDFTNTKPMIIKKLYLIHLLKSSDKNSKLGKLWSLMEKDQKETIIDADFREIMRGNPVLMEEFSKRLWEIQTYKKGLIMPKKMALMGRNVACMLIPLNITRLHISKDSFAHGTLNILMSHGIQPRLRKVFDYYGRTNHEMALLEGLSITELHNAPLEAPGLRMTYGLEAMECIDGLPLTSSRDSEDPALRKEYYHQTEEECSFVAFSFFHLKSCFVMLGYGLGISLVVFLLEIVFQSVKTRVSRLAGHSQ